MTGFKQTLVSGAQTALNATRHIALGLCLLNACIAPAQTHAKVDAGPAKNCAEAMCTGECKMCDATPYCFHTPPPSSPSDNAKAPSCPAKQPTFSRQGLLGAWYELPQRNGLFSVFARQPKENARFIGGFQFDAKGVLHRSTLGPTDGPVGVDGQYQFDGRMLKMWLNYPGFEPTAPRKTVETRYEVLLLTPDEMHWRELRIPPLRAPRIAKTSLYGYWTGAHDKADTFHWQRCKVANTGADCPLHLRADGTAEVYTATAPGASGRVCPATWRLSEFNVLFVDALSTCDAHRSGAFTIAGKPGAYTSWNSYSGFYWPKHMLSDPIGDTPTAPKSVTNVPQSLEMTQTTVPGRKRGMTWGVANPVASNGVAGVSCHGSPKVKGGSCDAYEGDTDCASKLPLLCVNVDGSPRPSELVVSFYGGWVGGRLQVTPPVQGSRFKTRAAADLFCAKTLGAGWRVAEHHDGVVDDHGHHGGWGFYGKGDLPTTTRFWVAINDQPSACWAP